MFWPLEHPVSVSKSTSSVESIFSDPQHSPTSVCIQNDTIWHPPHTRATIGFYCTSTTHQSPLANNMKMAGGEWPPVHCSDSHECPVYMLPGSTLFSACFETASVYLTLCFASGRTLPEYCLKLCQSCFLPHNFLVIISFILECNYIVIRSHHSPQRSGFDPRPVYKVLWCNNWHWGMCWPDYVSFSIYLSPNMRSI